MFWNSLYQCYKRSYLDTKLLRVFILTLNFHILMVSQSKLLAAPLLALLL